MTFTRLKFRLFQVSTESTKASAKTTLEITNAIYEVVPMSEPTKDNSAEVPEMIQLLAQARKYLDDVKSLKEQTEANLKQAEVSRKNADSEALLAFNAKKACEDHATTVANVKGTVEADANTIATNKQRSDEAIAGSDDCESDRGCRRSRQLTVGAGR